MTRHSTGGETRVLDIRKIANRLFERDGIRKRICSDFGFEDRGEPMVMAERLVRSMGQVLPKRESETENCGDGSTVFRAATLALASNMRQWSRFLKSRKEFECLLENYDPVAFSRAVRSDGDRVERLRECLGGQTGRADAKAIVKWADILAENPEYFQALTSLRNEIARLVECDEIVPVLAAFLGSPRKAAEKNWPPPHGRGSWKTPGMRTALASEMLRNLHWAGFKPDRHINRLLYKWFPDMVAEKSARAWDLARNVLCCRSQDVWNDIKFALVGIAVTPEDCNLTIADNLVWALGSYVEKKGKESEVVYWKAATSA